MVTTRLSAAPSLLACLILMSVTSGKSHKVWSSCTHSIENNSCKQLSFPTPKGRKEETEQGLLRDHDTNLVRIFQFLSTPLDATVCCHQDDELSTGWFPDLEGLCVEGLFQGLHADEVLEFEVASCGPTLAELLDEALEAEADSLACQEVAVLDLSSHVLWQERLVARSMQEGKFFF